MPYKTSGTLSTDRSSPTNETITVDDWSAVTLGENLVSDNGIVRLAQTIPDSQLTDYWPTTAGSGQTVDNQNSDRDMTVSGASWQDGDGIDGWHLEYDGTAETTVTDTAFATSSFTVMAWVKPTATGESNAIVTRTSSDSSSGLNIIWDRNGNGGFTGFCNNADGGENIELGGGTSFTITTGTWAFVAVTADFANNEVTMYAAAPSNSSVSQIDSSANYTDDIDMGDINTISAGYNEFTGGIDAPQFGIDQVQTQSEIDSFFQDSKDFFLSESSASAITSGGHAHQFLPQIDPQAITLNGKTTVTWQEYDGANSNGIMQARQYDESNGTWTDTYTIDTIGLDRHYSPAVQPDSSDNLHVIYGSAHGDPTEHAVSTSSNDVTSWDTSATDLSFSRFRYKRMHSNGDNIYILTNYGPDGSDQRGGIIESTDAGSSWSSTDLVNIGNRWMYFTDSERSGDEFTFLATLRYNDGSSGQDHREVVFATYDRSAEQLVGPDGSSTSVPVTSVTDLADINAIVDDVTDPYGGEFIERDGTPHVVTTRHDSGSVSAHHFEWGGSSWVETTIASGLASDSMWSGHFFRLEDTGTSLQVLETLWMRNAVDKSLGVWESTDSGGSWSNRQTVREFPGLQYGLRAIQRVRGSEDIAWMGVEETDPSSFEAGGAKIFAFDSDWSVIGP